MFQDAASLADIIGAIGVMVSLIFVGVQVMQANRLAREAAEQKQIESIGVISRLIVEHPQLQESLARAQLGEAPTPAEQVLHMAMSTFIERTWEALYFQYRAGRVDPELWEAHHTQARAGYGLPMVKAAWEQRKHWFSKSYRDYRDAQAENVSGDARLPYDIKPAAPPAQKN